MESWRETHRVLWAKWKSGCPHPGYWPAFQHLELEQKQIWLLVEPIPLKYMKVNWDDDIPNIWENESHVPNHQPEMHLIILDSNRTMRRPEPQRTQPYAILGEVDLLDLPSRNFTQPWKMGCLRMMYILKGVMFRGCHGYSYSIVWLYIYI